LTTATLGLAWAGEASPAHASAHARETSAEEAIIEGIEGIENTQGLRADIGFSMTRAAPEHRSAGRTGA